MTPGLRPGRDPERRAVAAVDEDFLVAALHELVALPSLPGHEEPAQDYVAATLESLGADVDHFPLDVQALESHPAYSSEFPRRRPTGVVGGVGTDRSAGRTLLVNAHVDVVPEGDPGQWTHEPFVPTVVGRRLYGRGACDTKGGVAAGLAAVKALRDAGIELAGRLLVNTVIGEEDGGSGTLGTLLHGHAADAAVVLEPTGLAVSPAVAGALSFRITVRGRAAHGCLREEGVSAIEKFPQVHRALLELERERNARAAEPLFARLERPFAICTGRLEAGDWASSEADWLQVSGRYGVAPDEDLASARAELERAVREAAASDPWLLDHPPSVEWVGGQFLPARTPVDAPVVEVLRAAASTAVGRPVSLEGQPYGCDMGLLVQVGGIPTCVFGPGDIRTAHAVDEWVDLDEVVTCARTLVIAAVRMCS